MIIFKIGLYLKVVEIERAICKSILLSSRTTQSAKGAGIQFLGRVTLSSESTDLICSFSRQVCT